MKIFIFHILNFFSRFPFFDIFCGPGEPSKREGEERQRSWTVPGSEESEHMSRCMLRINLRVQLNFASLLLSFFQDSIQNQGNYIIESAMKTILGLICNMNAL